MNRQGLRFIDLFSGLGGFHAALTRLGHTCVFASEIDAELRDLYKSNFGLYPATDIRETWKHVPPHDILCAGFPCQPFSKAGSQRGFTCPTSGDLFEYILKVADKHKPRYLILENVSNILRHAKGETWRSMQTSLLARGYSVDCKELSPHLMGIPQVRYRAIVVASLKGLSDFRWPAPEADLGCMHLSSILDKSPRGADELPQSYIRYLDVWEEFLDRLDDDCKLPSFPIWSMEFGASYPLTKKSPTAYDYRYLARFKGAFGEELRGKSKIQQLAALPIYVRTEARELPAWKLRFIRQNREFFQMHRARLRDWLPKVKEFPPSFQKFEWNWKDGEHTVWDKVIQFRASGIRVKNPSAAPSLIASTASQIPVVAWQRRYMTIRECARLQSLGSLKSLPASKGRAIKALGNAVNADVIHEVAKRLVRVELKKFTCRPIDTSATAIALNS